MTVHAAVYFILVSWAIAAVVRKWRRRHPHWQDRLDSMIHSYPVFGEELS